MKVNIPCTDGVNNYNSLAEMADALGIRRDTLYQRYHRGKPLLVGHECKDHAGNQYANKKEMVDSYNVAYATFNTRLRDGRTLEEALTGNFDRKYCCCDHLGNRFHNEKEMCKAYNVSYNTYRKRKQKGYSLKECLLGNPEMKVGSKGVKCRDHLGNEFNSISDMCKAYGIKVVTFRMRQIRKGMTVEQALTTPLYS